MLVSYNWLKRHVKLSDSLSPEDLALKLTMSTVEVEGMENQEKNLENIVVGRILSLEKHPKADKLQLCAVDTRGKKLSIVCGGSNLREGMLVALAKIGAKVRWHGENELMELKSAEIRGVKSQGMICASTEIGLGEMFPLKDEHEILDLSEMAKKSDVGKPVAKVLGLDDVIFEIDNKSMTHRPDLWGHYGLAREAAALYGRKLNEYEIKGIKSSKKTKLEVEVENKEMCPRYMAVRIDGVKVGPSPDWLKKLLFAAGLHPINNLVDITNYLLLDLGQPMHAFDTKGIANSKSEAQNPKIIVRRAKEKESLKLLDERTVKLDPSILVIADAEKPVALAGVMGGESSAIQPDTTSIILESANFEPSVIRRAALKLDCRTDSSSRFEKSLDPTNAQLALEKAVEMILEFCPGAEVASEVVDESDYHLKQGPIEVSLDFLRCKIGLAIEIKEVVSILERLGFEVKVKKDLLSIKVPSWRATRDISMADDLVEEVARIYGYDNIKPSLPVFPIVPPLINYLCRMEHCLRAVLVRELDYAEVYNYSFISREQAEKIGDSEEYVELENPLSKEKPLLRRSLLPNLLENAVENIENFDEVKILEIGKIFLPDLPGPRVKEKSDELLPRQDTWLAALNANKKDDCPFTAARQAAETVLAEFHLPLNLVRPSQLKPWMHPTRAGEIMLGETSIGFVYEINPVVAKKFGFENRAGIFEININYLLDAVGEEKIAYKKISTHPDVIRDLAIVVDKKVSYEQIVQELSQVDSLVKSVELFDVYEGEPIAEDKKSMAFHLIYRHPERTLTAEETNAVQDKIVEMLDKKFKAEIRG